MNPLETSRNTPLQVTIRDCLVGAWIARDSDPTWMIDIGGQEHRGPAFDLSRHASSADVKDMLRDWAKQHAELFD